MRRLVSLVLLAISLGLLFVEAPGSFLREAWFVTVVLGMTIATRSASWRAALSGLGLGIGVAAPAMIAFGWLLAKAGLDSSEGGVGSWGIVPISEELVKLATVFFAGWLYQRKSRLTFNPSDWLLVGCAVGAGFAMVENAQLVSNSPGVLRDMARQYGPSWIVPGAWGAAGYVGHAAATGAAAAGVGLFIAMRRTADAASRSLAWAALAAPFAWITLEHVLANLQVDTGSRVTFLLGNGRLTPWLFLVLAAIVVFRDFKLVDRAIARSRILRMRRAAVREALMGVVMPKRRTLWQRVIRALAEQRLANAAAWATLEELTTEGRQR